MKIDSLFYEILLIGMPIVLIFGGLLRYLQSSIRRRAEQLENSIEAFSSKYLL